MLRKRIQSWLTLTAARRRIVASPLPPDLKREITRTAKTLLCRPAHRFANPASVVGAQISYVEPTQLRYLFEEIFVGAPYFFHSATDQPVIIDCGSNIGMSVLFFKKLYPAARVAAFEPDPATFELLKKNVTQNGLEHVELHRCALGERDETADFYRSREAGGLMMSLMKERMDGVKLSVPVRRLSQFIDAEIDLLKLDVEGAEDQVLGDLAASGKLARIRQIHLEYHHHIVAGMDRLGAILALLEQGGFGYQLLAKCEKWATPGAFQDVAIYAYRKNA